MEICFNFTNYFENICQNFIITKMKKKKKGKKKEKKTKKPA
jgi:hypothetical protein